MYKFTVPVFGEGVVYDSPLDERQQQVKMLSALDEHEVGDEAEAPLSLSLSLR